LLAGPNKAAAFELHVFSILQTIGQETILLNWDLVGGVVVFCFDETLFQKGSALCERNVN